LAADKIKWMTNIGNVETPLKIALISKHKVYSTPRCEHLISILHLDYLPKSDEPVKKNSENLIETVIYCSEEFLTHYKIMSEDMYFTVVEPYVLSKVLIGASTDETLQWVKTQEFERGMLIAHTSNNPVLFRQDDIFLSQPNSFYGKNTALVLDRFKEMVTLSCSPWKQGLCTSKTEIVFVKAENLASQRNENKSIDCGDCFNVKVKNFSELDMRGRTSLLLR